MRCKCAHMLLFFTVVVVPAAATAALRSATDGAVAVSTELGSVRGERLADGTARFLGIPYAQQPVGDLRFRPAAAVAPWKPTVLDATTFGPACLQSDVWFVPPTITNTSAEACCVVWGGWRMPGGLFIRVPFIPCPTYTVSHLEFWQTGSSHNEVSMS